MRSSSCLIAGRKTFQDILFLGAVPSCPSTSLPPKETEYSYSPFVSQRDLLVGLPLTRTATFEGIIHPAGEPPLSGSPSILELAATSPRHVHARFYTHHPLLVPQFLFLPLSLFFVLSSFIPVRAGFILERIRFDPMRDGDVCRKPTARLSGGSLSARRRSADPISKRVRAPRF